MGEMALGIDVGSSGVRVTAVGSDGCRAAFAAVPMATAREEGTSFVQDPMTWWNAARQALQMLRHQIDFARIRALAVDGTSGTLVGVDAGGRPITPGLMFNSPAQDEIVGAIAAVASRETAAHGRTSALARAITVQHAPGVVRVLHQADWISGLFSGRFDVTDENNALKTGYDPVARCWPDWVERAGMLPDRLPNVVEPGTITGNILHNRAAEFGLPANTMIVAGTTDGCAAFLAAGASKLGEAVTSLGSTLVLKFLCDRPLFATDLGIYSHRTAAGWVSGGASNSGGAAIGRHFSLDRVRVLSKHMRPDVATGLNFYPLSGRGERFPLNNPDMEAQLDPRPTDDAHFLQGLMEGVANIETRGYALLQQMSGTQLASIRTVGGGSRSLPWHTIRSRILGVTLMDPDDDQPAVGTARLAFRGLFN